MTKLAVAVAGVHGGSGVPTSGTSSFHEQTASPAVASEPFAPFLGSTKVPLSPLQSKWQMPPLYALLSESMFAISRVRLVGTGPMQQCSGHAWHKPPDRSKLKLVKFTASMST